MLDRRALRLVEQEQILEVVGMVVAWGKEGPGDGERGRGADGGDGHRHGVGSGVWRRREGTREWGVGEKYCTSLLRVRALMLRVWAHAAGREGLAPSA